MYLCNTHLLSIEYITTAYSHTCIDDIDLHICQPIAMYTYIYIYIYTHKYIRYVCTLVDIKTTHHFGLSGKLKTLTSLLCGVPTV